MDACNMTVCRRPIAGASASDFWHRCIHRCRTLTSPTPCLPEVGGAPGQPPSQQLPQDHPEGKDICA